MRTPDERTRIHEAIEHLERALRLLDSLGHSIAAAQLDHVIHMLEVSLESDCGV